MSDRTVRPDDLTVRMLDAIDALPVPAGPSALRPRRSRAARVGPVPLLVALAVALAVAIATPAGQSAVAEAARLIERMIGTSPWSAYYVDLAARDAAGAPAQRLMFAPGVFPGRPTQVTSLAEIWHGSWSADGELFLAGAGSKVHVGDRAGAVREVADVGEMRITAVAWVGQRRIAAMARGTDQDRVVRADLATGAVEQRSIPAGTRLQPAGDQLWGTFSPDGRWVVPGGPAACRAVRVYDLRADRMIDLVDGVARRGLAIGWLSDSRLVWATCDAGGATISVVVGHPDAPPSVLGTVPFTARSPGPVVDPARERILISSSRPGEQGVIVALGLDGHLTELVRLPELTTDRDFGVVHTGVVSRDGRLLSFRVAEVRNGQPRSRAGFIDLVTGAVTFACEIDCRRLGLR